MEQLIHQLQSLRLRARILLIVQRAAVVVAWAVGVGLVLVLLDYLFRLPGPIRLLNLIAGAVGLLFLLRRDLVPAFRFHPTLTQLALRVESALPQLSGHLASGVEFALSGTDRGNPLAARSVRETSSRAAGSALGSAIRPRRTLRDVFVAIVLIGAAAAGAAASPGLAQTGLARLFMPFGSAAWPARTAVTSLMDDVLEGRTVYRRGQSLVLRARNDTAGDPAGVVRAVVRYQRAGERGPWTTLLLSHQGNGVHERLVDTDAESIEFSFLTSDAQTETLRVELVPAPAIVRASLSVQPPAYASGWVVPLEAELGPGIDDRAATERASLPGSEAVLEMSFTKPLPVAAFADPHVWLGWPADAQMPDVALAARDGMADGAALSWRLEATTTMDLHLEDEHGLTNDEDIGYRVTVVDDLLPSVTLTEPNRDQAVLATAVLPVVAEASDDVALATVAVRSRRERAGASLVTDFRAESDLASDEGRLESTLDLATLDLQKGDVVVLEALAHDRYELDGEGHDPTVSPARRLRIIDEVDLVSALRQHLAAVRQNAIRVDALQGELQDDLATHSAQPGSAAAQAEVAERIAEQSEALADIRREMERNRLGDETLDNLLRQSNDLLEFAGRAASEAVAELQRRESEGPAARPEQPEDEPSLAEPAPEDRPAAESQQKVRDELEDLIELLDRDEDTWVVQHQLESMLEAQHQLEQRTSQLGQETIGQSRDDLSPAQLSELERIVERQRELRDAAQRAIEEMRRRAEALEEVDPRSAAGMRTAADTGEKQELDRDMETAAERADQNQMQSANASQQAASRTLERMLEDIESTQRARAQELLRQLDSLLESIKRLVEVQENELIALDQGRAAGDFTGRDRAMIRLAQNTQSVAASARQSGQETRRIARALDRAADRQGAAVAALRAQPLDDALAQEAEEQALDLLHEAMELAEALKEQTQEDEVRQKREELVTAYRELMEKQIVVRDDTRELDTGEPLSRRQLVESRRLGNVQGDIRTALSDLRASTRELSDSEVFEFVHRLMDRWAEDASASLWEGQVDADVLDRQRMIAESIAQQIEALEAQANPDPLDDGQPGEQQAGGGQPGGQPPALIPPVAELRRLKGLQEQLFRETRLIDERGDLSAVQVRTRLRDLGAMQRETLSIGERMLEALSQQPGGPPPAPPETGGGS